MTVEIVPAGFPRDREAVASLFDAYAKSLGIDLSFQSFADELSQLPGKYAADKGGALMIAYIANEQPARIIGCVAVRAFPLPATCELKRLYVVPECRGIGAAQGLIESAMTRAKALGYREMLLDTLPSMEAARKLYVRYGFEGVDKYYDSPIEGTVFMRAMLAADPDSAAGTTFA